MQDHLGSNNNYNKYKTRNINSGLQQYYSNQANTENGSKSKNSLGSFNNKIIKRYHKKKYSELFNILDNNKKRVLYEKKSKNKK